MSIYDKASLVLIPSGTKTSKVFSQKPVNGDGDFTFSRSTAATRVNADGNIEKETQNLINYSNTFSTGWTKDRILSVTSGQAGYDGSNDAWLLVPTNVVTYHTIRQSSSQTGVVTISVYAKAETYDGILLYSSSNTNGKFFNVSNGTLGDDFGGNVIDATITDVGNGWYRCSVTLNKTGTGSIEVLLSSDGVNTYTFAGDGVGGVYIQDFQLEQGLVARDYIETTTAAVEGGITDNVPRLDYTDSSCPALLLEPQRTNAYLNSEYFGSWNSNRADLTANAVTSPEGVTNSYKVAQQSGFTISPNVNITGLTANTYTASIFAKKGTWDYIAVSFNGVSYFNLDSGTKGTTHPNHTSSIEDYGNGWYRCTITITTTSTQTIAYYIAESNSTLSTPDTQGYAYIYGAQIESASSYATSYIPTYGTSVTRSDDDMTTDFSSAIATNGSATIFFHDLGVADSDDINTTSASYRYQASTGNYVSLTTNDTAWRLRVQGGGSSNFKGLNDHPKTSPIKVAVIVSSTHYSIFANGVKEVDNESLTTTGDFSSIQNFITNIQDNTGVRKAVQHLVFPTALTDQEAIDLTTL